MLSGRRVTFQRAFRNFNSTIALNIGVPATDTDLRNGTILTHGNAIVEKTLHNALLDRGRTRTFNLTGGSGNKFNEGQFEKSSGLIPSKFSESIRAQDYIKILVELTLQAKLDPNFGQKLLAENYLTRIELSSVVQGVLSLSNYSDIVPDAVKDAHSIEMVFDLYKLYTQADRSTSLDPLRLYDLNRFIKFFIKHSQLGKAQIVLDQILSFGGNKLPCDVPTAINYLQLRCGALPRSWRVNNVPRYKVRVSGAAEGQLSSSKYKAFDKKTLLALVNSLNNPSSNWSCKSSDGLESAIIYSLGFMGQVQMLEDYIFKRWEIALGVVKSNGVVSSSLPPSSEVLVSILTSFAYNKEIVSALQLMDMFINKYPELKLDRIFWRRLFQHSTRIWDRRSDPYGQLSKGCWNVMTTWHDQRCLKLDMDIPLLEERYKVLRMTNDYNGAMQVISWFAPQLRDQAPLSPIESAVLQKYFKLVLKKHASMGYYQKPLRFVKEYSPNREFAALFRSYFFEHKERYMKRKQQRHESAQLKQKEFDEEEEDRMLLGRLW
ncbi:LADA_0H05116g1_1 [Lachancea dasiensis]|uniref:ATPase expression protein 2, mitochondrial n=1 Tax=Lachancea dasiensis TaxID=1072105 RepID=A0A1G4K109_9SACH|nr:LADA_0H05116g1_1 [Lachancea dasiensis]